MFLIEGDKDYVLGVGLGGVAANDKYSRAG